MSKSRSPDSIPYRPTARSWMRCATRSFHSTDRACPSSSITNAMAAAPKRCDQRQQPRDLPLPVLQVDRVHDPLAAVQLQRRLDHRDLGRIEYQRQRRLRAQLARVALQCRVPPDAPRSRPSGRARAPPPPPARVPAPPPHPRPLQQQVAERPVTPSRSSAPPPPGTTCPARRARSNRGNCTLPRASPAAPSAVAARRPRWPPRSAPAWCRNSPPRCSCQAPPRRCAGSARTPRARAG